MTNPKIDLIKKLLRLGRDQAATSAEAAQALARALKLASEEGINLDQIDPDDEAGNHGLTHDEIMIRQLGIIEREAIYVVMDFFGVRSLVGQGDKIILNFIGLPDAVQISRYSYEYLTQAAQRAWRKNKDKRLKREGFILGFFAAIRSQMPDTFRALPGTALALSAEHYVRSVICPEAEITNVKESKKKVTEGSYLRGMEAGYQAGIRNALKDSSRTIE